ncbi:MAG: sel1 repeat family protein [Marichromatium sp.]|nr:sel1 repeat family protein [Marichromatium sp.]
MPSIHLNTATTITGLTRRTLWRYIKDSRLHPLHTPSNGKTRLDLDEVLALRGTQLDSDDEALVLAADAGEPEAQCDLGIWLLERDRPKAARDWFRLAARAGHADAMCWLGRDLLLGEGGAPDQAEGMRWLHQAAALELPLAMELVTTLLGADGERGRASGDRQALRELLDAVERRVLLGALEATA